MLHYNNDFTDMKLFYLLISISFITACDPSVDYSQIVQNDSDYDIWLKYKTLNQYDSFLLRKRQETIIFEYHGLGSPVTYENCDSFLSDSTELLVKDSINLIVFADIDNQDIWTYTLLRDDRYGSGICECRFILTNSDVK